MTTREHGLGGRGRLLALLAAVAFIAVLGAGVRPAAFALAQTGLISPTSGPAGTTVTISGAGFPVGSTTAIFGAAPTTAYCYTSTSCTTAAPVQPAGVTTVQVTIGGILVGTFTYTGTSASGSISPPSGPAGTTVTATGAGFPIGTVLAQFGSAVATATCPNSTTCTMVAPQQLAGVTTVEVVIAGIPVGTFTYTGSASGAISPSSGSAGTVVTFTGTNFPVGTTTAVFGNVSVVATCSSTTICTATAPQPSAGATTVTVYLVVNGSLVNEGTFNYGAGAGNLSPSSGPAGTAVTISGAGLPVGTATVLFGGVTTTATCTSLTVCTTVAPAQPAGTTSVTVYLLVNGSPINEGTFTYTTGVSGGVTPSSGAAGTTVTLTGSGFPVGTATAIFGNASATATCTSTTTCTVVAPAQPAGTTTVTVYLVNNGQLVNVGTFNYGAASGNLSPSSGSAGTVVTITGAGFVPGAATILFGSVSATGATCASTTQCTATAPAQAAGTTSVTVYVVANGQLLNEGTFTYTSGSSVTISSISPTSGAAGTTVTIAGSGFVSGQTTIDFGATAATNVTCTTTSCTATVPAGSGTVNVIANVNGQVSNAVQFTYGAGSSSLTVSINGPNSATVGQSVTFTAAVTGTPPSDAVYNWSFGDGGGNFGQSASHTYNTAGTYTLTLVVTQGTSVISNTANATITVTGGSSSSSGSSVTYQAGWNLVSGPNGAVFSQADGPLYTFQAGDTNYEQISDTTGIHGAWGYWAYFAAPTVVSISGSGPSLPVTVTVPAGGYAMIGNPSTTRTVTVTGADAVYTWSPAANSYVSQGTSATLGIGQGAWVYSAAGAVVTIQ